jgi:hypothetical protein
MEARFRVTNSACSIGTLLSFASNFYQERLYLRNVATRGPEARLYASMLGGVCFAVGCFIYAWTCELLVLRPSRLVFLILILINSAAFPHVTYIAPCIGIAIVVYGIYSIYVSVFVYLADAYTIYASSALAGEFLCALAFWYTK